MAETLAVQDMLPNKFEPKRKFRWIFAIEGIDAFLMKAATRPNMTFSEQELHFINSRRYLAGKMNFDPITVTLYDPIAPSGAQQVMEWVRTHFESVSGRAGYADFYKRDCQIKMLDPVGTVVELWDLKGCMLNNANFNDLDYTAEDPTEIALGIRFDNCVLQY
tara:strand:+ start:1498 stop:1986 length:489 start_codon:yes stop_codon:yes gene_type:complete